MVSSKEPVQMPMTLATGIELTDEGCLLLLKLATTLFGHTYDDIRVIQERSDDKRKDYLAMTIFDPDTKVPKVSRKDTIHWLEFVLFTVPSQIEAIYQAVEKQFAKAEAIQLTMQLHGAYYSDPNDCLVLLNKALTLTGYAITIFKRVKANRENDMTDQYYQYD